MCERYFRLACAVFRRLEEAFFEEGVELVQSLFAVELLSRRV